MASPRRRSQAPQPESDIAPGEACGLPSLQMIRTAAGVAENCPQGRAKGLCQQGSSTTRTRRQVYTHVSSAGRRRSAAADGKAGQGFVRAVESPVQVEIDVEVPLRGRHVPHLFEKALTGVVDQDVASAELAVHSGEQRAG